MVVECATGQHLSSKSQLDFHMRAFRSQDSRCGREREREGGRESEGEGERGLKTAVPGQGTTSGGTGQGSVATCKTAETGSTARPGGLGTARCHQARRGARESERERYERIRGSILNFTQDTK